VIDEQEAHATLAALADLDIEVSESQR